MDIIGIDVSIVYNSVLSPRSGGENENHTFYKLIRLLSSLYAREPNAAACVSTVSACFPAAGGETAKTRDGKHICEKRIFYV